MSNETGPAIGSLGQKKDKLVGDLKVAVADANELLNELTHLSSEEFAAARARIEAQLANAMSGLRLARSETARQACRVARASSDYARENPWRLAAFVVAAFASAVLVSRCARLPGRHEQ